MKLSKKRLTAYTLLLINTVVWGAAFIIVKPALDIISPFNFLFSRYVLASLLCLPILIYFLRKIKVTGRILLTIVLLELLGTTINLALLYLGLARTSAIETSLISTTAPLFTVLLGIMILKEKQERHEWVGTLLSFIGMIVLTIFPAFQAVGAESSLIGNMLIVSAIFTESIYFIAAKKYYKKIPKLFVASISFIVGALSFGFLTLWQNLWSFSAVATEVSLNFSNFSVGFATFYMAVFGSIIGLTLYIKGQDSIEASEASLFRYLQPAVYLPLGVLVLGESITVAQWLGLALILLGFLLAELNRKKKL